MRYLGFVVWSAEPVCVCDFGHDSWLVDHVVVCECVTCGATWIRERRENQE